MGLLGCLVLIWGLGSAGMALAGYCSQERWDHASDAQRAFTADWKGEKADCDAHKALFRKTKFTHQNLSFRELEAFIRHSPEESRDIFMDHAFRLEDQAVALRDTMASLETVIDAGRAAAGEWYVLAGACHQRNPGNLERGKNNAAKVERHLTDAREALTDMKLMYEVYCRERDLLQRWEKVLIELKVEFP